MNNAIFFVFAIILFSCSPQQRLTRLLDNHPKLLKSFDKEVTVIDTFINVDTFIVEAVRDSSIFIRPVLNTQNKDTFVLNNEDFFTKVEIQNEIIETGDTIESVKILTVVKEKQVVTTDTLYKHIKVKVPCKCPEISTNNISWWHWILSIIILLIGIWLGVRFLK